MPKRRARSVKLDTLFGKTFGVLDDGFVRIIDYLGTDASVVQAAKVSYGKGTKTILDDSKLIRFLMRNRHTSPFEMCELKLHVRVPMDCWQQWIRHRTASVNEYSTRYSIAIDAARCTKPSEWRIQSTENRQGSNGKIDVNNGKMLSEREFNIQSACRETYEERLKIGVAREQARKDLPLSTYTEAYWKIDLHNLLHFLELRMNPLAQYEIRQYANIIGHQIVYKWVPITWEAFLDYRLNALTISKTETKYLALLNSGKQNEIIAQMQNNGWLQSDKNVLKPNREAAEFAAKLERLGLKIPWLT
jgi:thymidylate synthase (FAD)